jgi:hypothetical protein
VFWGAHPKKPVPHVKAQFWHWFFGFSGIFQIGIGFLLFFVEINRQACTMNRGIDLFDKT